MWKGLTWALSQLERGLFEGADYKRKKVEGSYKSHKWGQKCKFLLFSSNWPNYLDAFRLILSVIRTNSKLTPLLMIMLFLKALEENLRVISQNNLCVIICLTLIACILNSVLELWGESSTWSFLRARGLMHWVNPLPLSFPARWMAWLTSFRQDRSSVWLLHLIL